MRLLLILACSTFTTILVVSILTMKYSLKPSIDWSNLAKFESRKLWLQQADIKLEPLQFWAAIYFIGLIGFVIVFSLSHVFLISVVIGIATAFVPYSLIAKRRLEISKRLMNIWPDTLRDINATIASGHSLSFALKVISQQGEEPIASHMRRFSALEKSIGFSAALETVREEMNDATSDKVIEVLIMANDRGGKVVKEIIDDLIFSTSEEISLAETIENESLEMKINSRAVVILPWCVLLLLILSGGVFREYYQSKAGTFVIFLGVLLTVLGLVVLNKLSKIDVEPRVFRSEAK